MKIVGCDLHTRYQQIAMACGPAFEPPEPNQKWVPRSRVLCEGGNDAADSGGSLELYATLSRKEIPPQPSLILTGPASSSR